MEMQEGFAITFIGHATCLIQSRAGAILTDPHLGHRHFFWRRQAPLPIKPGALPDLAGILISHVHYDHLDIESFKYIPSTTPIIAPQGTAPIMKRFLNNPIIEIAHWVPYTLAEGIVVTAVPVRHMGGRFLPNLRYRQNNGYVIQMDGHHLYFAGDTGYGTHFREVGHMYPIDVALLPLDALLPHWWSVGRSLNGLEALQAFQDLKARHAMPIHWGAFGASGVSARHLDALRRHAVERGLHDRVHIVEPGGVWTS